MLGAQEGERFVVLLLKGGEEIGAEGLHLLADFGRLADQKLEADERQGLIQAAHDRVYVEPLGGGADQQRRVDRRIEQGQLLDRRLGCSGCCGS